MGKRGERTMKGGLKKCRRASVIQLTVVPSGPAGREKNHFKSSSVAVATIYATLCLAAFCMLSLNEPWSACSEAVGTVVTSMQPRIR